MHAISDSVLGVIEQVLMHPPFDNVPVALERLVPNEVAPVALIEKRNGGGFCLEVTADRWRLIISP